MRSVGLFGLIAAILLAGGLARADDPATTGSPSKKVSEPQFCVQVIACGAKAGERRQYPTPCDARADGATDVAPMVGANCN
jgi:hypothetical protein